MADAAAQGTDGWRIDRAGCITGSIFRDALDLQPGGGVFQSGPRKGQVKPPLSSAAREKVKRVLAFERMSKMPAHEIGGRALAWGKDLEPYARAEFEVATGMIVEQCGFIRHPRYPFAGASPDGLIVDRSAGLEMKCPMDEAVHLLTWEQGMPEDHVAQVQGGMWCTGREEWWFVSYDARALEKYRLYVQRIPRDEDYIRNVLEPGVLQFEAELVAYMARLEKRHAEVQALLMAA